MGDCALITPVYLEIALLSGARSGTQATGQVISAIDIADISIRTLCEEGDYPQRSVGGVHRDFYPCPPRGGRLAYLLQMCSNNLFLSTPSARRATVGVGNGVVTGSISIHALREEGDTDDQRGGGGQWNFYPRPPRGGRPSVMSQQTDTILFLSTPSARRTTRRLTSWGGVLKISIHALREEGDGIQQRNLCTGHNFYPRPPRGGRH